jgi:hypothetical protein
VTTNLENSPGEDCCLGPGKIESQKMLDFASKYAIDSFK